MLSEEGRAVYKKYGYLTEKKEALKFAPGAKIGGEYKLPGKYFQIVRKNWQNK